MTERIRRWLTFPIRTRAHAAWSAALAVALALAGWYGLGVLRFNAAKAAAQQALANYDFPEAQRQLAECRRLRPGDNETLLLAVQAARRDGRLDDARDFLDQCPDSTLDSALQWVLLRVQRGQVKEHVYDLIDQLEVRHPASEQILESLAQGSVHVYRLEEASFWIKQLRDRYPKNPVGRLIEAQMNETMRRREQALALIRGLLDDFPHHDKARLYFADLLVKHRQYEEAAQQYRELYRRRPADVEPLLGLVRCLVDLERHDEAAELTRVLEEKHADSSEALLESGRFALHRNRPEDAEPLFRRAVLLSPNDREIHYALAVCLEQLGRKEEARQHLDRFQQIETDMKNLDKAFQAMVKNPADPGPRSEAGRICLRNGQVVEGLRWLAGALQVDPNHGPTHLALAEHFAAQGDAAQAAYHRQRIR